jgi:hypothetical protein
MTVETAHQYVISSRSPRAGLSGYTLVLLGLSILLGALWADPGLVAWRGPWGWLLPQLVLLVLLGVMILRIRRQRASAQRLEAAFEAVQLRRWDEARVLLDEILSQPVRLSVVRTELLLALAALAESEHSYEASQHIYEQVLQENRADPIQLHTARVALAAAMLRTGQLTDAVNLIERLERAALPELLRAQVELLALFREISMGQVEASISRASERRALFRKYLSTKAGYGYALLAAAFDRADQPAVAQKHWHDATLLVRPEELLDRFGELEPVARKYAAARNPIAAKRDES